jgi:DNA-binding transcriptional regulator YhcF (GntR family)
MFEPKDQVFESKDKVITKIMREKLLTGEFMHRDKLPPVLELAKSFKVSVNTITKAVTNLKQEGLLVAKPGKGLFRQNIGKHTKTIIPPLKNTVQWSYSIAPQKKIKIFLEDSIEWQLESWHKFFDDICTDELDLKIEIDTIKENYKISEMDIYIGGFNRLNTLNIPLDNWISVEKLSEFGNLSYEGMNISPEDIKFSRKPFAMPIANITPSLWGASNKELTIETPKGILDFIEQASTPNESNIRYQIWTGGFLLSNCGCDFLMPFVESGEITNTEHFSENLPVLRKLFLSQQLIWQHGKLTNNKAVFDKIISGRLDVIETPPQMRHIKPPQGVRELAYPMSDYLPVSPVVCLVNKNFPYLEESVRLISAMLEENNQRKLADTFKFDSIHPKVNVLNSPKPKKINISFPQEVISSAIYSIFSWELYYYLSGKEQSVDNFISMVNKKVKHCLSLNRVLDKVLDKVI